MVGVAIAILLYVMYGNPSVPIVSFCLFCGVAISVTAFVLCC